MALADGGDPSMQKQERNNGVVLAQFATPQYEIYQNGRFNFQVKYPTDILTPLSPPTNNDGRVFVSPTRDIRMVVYGRHQIDQSLEAYYQSQLQSANLRGAEVTYTYQNDDEYVISGYEPSGEVFYRRTLLRNENFLVLGFSYDRALQTEFDTVVAEIANSFQTSPELLINGSTKEYQPYEPPSNYRQIQIYFPEAGTEIFSEVAPVTRTTDRVDVVEYAVEQLLEGPTAAEQARLRDPAVQPVGESICDGETFTVDLIEGTAIVQFCRDLIIGGIGDSAGFRQAILSTLTQFATVTQVVLLDKNGGCLFDASGNNDCFSQLPEQFTSGTDRGE
jgi:hypothetical protein